MWYHGTFRELRPGDHLVIGWPSNWPDMPGVPEFDEPSEQVWIAAEAYIAFQYACDVVQRRGGEPRVYEVRPTGPLDSGGPNGYITDRTTTEPVLVLREVTDDVELAWKF